MHNNSEIQDRGQCVTPAAGSSWLFRLYITRDSPASVAAEQNLRAACDSHLAGRYTLEILEIQTATERAEDDRIFAVPTAMRVVPGPVRKVIGDLSDRDKLLAGLGIPATSIPAGPAVSTGDSDK